MYERAEDKTQYDESIMIQVNHMQSNSAVTAVIPCMQPHDNGHDEDLSLLSGGVDFGRYTHAVHHQDGLTSTLYKAVAPEGSGIVISTPGFSKLPCRVMLKLTHPATMDPPHDAHRECRLILKAKSAHVLEMIESFQLPGGNLAIATPCMQYDLEQRFRDGPLPLDSQQSFLSNLLEGLAFIHSCGIIHRDIKPSNLVLKSRSGPVFIADFGISWASYDPSCEPTDAKILDVGTTCYRPPEILFGDQSYDESLDVWAAGCVAAQIVSTTERTLFDAGDLGSELALIKSIFETIGTPNGKSWPGVLKLPDWGKMTFVEYTAQPWKAILPNASDAAIELVKSMIVYEKGDRMKAADWRDQRFFDGLAH